jgi:hypothetical protein
MLVLAKWEATPLAHAAITHSILRAPEWSPQLFNRIARSKAKRQRSVERTMQRWQPSGVSRNCCTTCRGQVTNSASALHSWSEDRENIGLSAIEWRELYLLCKSVGGREITLARDKDTADHEHRIVR